jgi:hypothetical protein
VNVVVEKILENTPVAVEKENLNVLPMGIDVVCLGLKEHIANGDMS